MIREQVGLTVNKYNKLNLFLCRCGHSPALFYVMEKSSML